MHKHILYLASGSSRRFGSNKLLHVLNSKPMYRYGLETLWHVVQRRTDCDLTVISRYEAIRETAESMGITAVDSPLSEGGVSYTIRAGLSALGKVGEGEYLLFVVADQPYLTAASVNGLLDLADQKVTCASLCWEDRPGNPALFSAALIPELMALEGDTGGRAVLKKHPCTYLQAASEKELEDIDTN